MMQYTHQAIENSVNEKKNDIETMHASHYLPSNIDTVYKKIAPCINKNNMKSSHCQLD